MKLGIRWRLTWFATAIVLVALAIAWTARTTWNEARQLDRRMSVVQVESFKIADQFQATLLDLNQMLREYQRHLEPKDWQKFVQESEDLDRWIDERSGKLTNPNEIKILDRINQAYDAYRADAHQMTNALSSLDPAAPVSVLLERAENQSKGLFHLGNELADAHREVVGDSIVHIQEYLAVLQRLVFTLLPVLLALGAWVAVVVYRDMIAPLRVTLFETRAIMERQEKLASLGVLATGVAHEIRNPLTAIKARLFMQQKRLQAGSLEAEDALFIKSEINRLDHIVKSVLQFARPAEPHLVRVAADVPLREVCQLMALQLENDGIQLKLEAVAPAQIEVDVHQIKQALINLVQNAAESIQRDGAITLRARSATHRLRGPPAAVVILEVEDTGKGISQEVQKRLFDPFFTTKESGTGLGLAIAARIVEKHGGILEFQTLMNRGTIFGIVLPECGNQ